MIRGLVGVAVWLSGCVLMPGACEQVAKRMMLLKGVLSDESED